MLDNGHQAVGDDCHIDLCLHRVLRSAPELLDFEVLFQPLEEQLCLPAVLVELGNQQGLQPDGVGQEHELTPLFLVPVSDESQPLRIVLRGIITRQDYLRIREDVLGQPAFPLDYFVLEVAFGADDEERLENVDAVESLEVVVASVEDVERSRLVGYHVHRLHVVYRSWSDVDEGRNLGLDFVHRVDLDAAFGGAEFRPFEHAQAQVDCGRVERIDVAVKLEDVGDPSPPRFVYHTVSEVLEDAEVPVLVGLGQVASCGLLSETEPVTFLVMSFQRDNQVSQALAIGQLAKHQDEQLVPAREVLDILVTVVFADKVVEVIPIQKVC